MRARRLAILPLWKVFANSCTWCDILMAPACMISFLPGPLYAVQEPLPRRGERNKLLASLFCALPVGRKPQVTRENVSTQSIPLS